MYELRSGMTWSNAVENDKEQKELRETYFVFYFDSGYTISIQYVNGDLIPEAVRFCQATLPQPAIICYQIGTYTQVDAQTVYGLPVK